MMGGAPKKTRNGHAKSGGARGVKAVIAGINGQALHVRDPLVGVRNPRTSNGLQLPWASGVCAHPRLSLMGTRGRTDPRAPVARLLFAMGAWCSKAGRYQVFNGYHRR